MAAAGFTGVEDPLAGARTFFEAFAEAPRPEALVEGLGSRFEISRASIKKWPSGSPIQAALDALAALMSTYGIGPDDVAALTVRLPDDRIHLVDDSDVPNLCVQHLLAVLLLDGRLGFQVAHDQARLRDPKVLALRQRIRVVPDAELTRARPPRQAIVRVTTRDGREFEERTRAVRGTPDNPMPRHEIEAKAQDLLGSVLGTGRARALTAEIWRIDDLPSVRLLRPLLQA
jgi:2-methylcitrate dehydratase PrpD